MAELLSQRGYAQGLISEEIHTAWNHIVGSKLAELSRPGKIRNGVLDIFVANATANQELTFRRREFARKLSEALPRQEISDLRIRVT